MSDSNPYELAYQRERKARLKAEKLLEDKSRELYLQNRRLEESYQQLQKQQAHMLTQDKLATLGTLSAGIAHEVNNPLAFVKSNFESLQQYHQAYDSVIERVVQLKPQLPESLLKEIEQILREMDIEFIQEDLPELMQDTAEGLTRVKDIIQNLRNFSRTQASDRVKSDVVDGLHSTLKLLSSELKNSVTLDLNLAPVGPIICNPNELNQVFLNIILNAKQATEAITHPVIQITSNQDSESVFITVRDNGCGMSEETRNQIFVPFFTTKAVGKGTGMGLAIAYSIIQEHGGDIMVESEPGKGSLFTIKLPKKERNQGA
ncbi:ATP-binding protein [uncultured Neptuniibacter sp.]|uniref:sensor histidine kinase n=1 Tax=uncultured Neptuniibacter sp. TaxID=502143 RepID=UPI0026272E69|nr:ATP-binding protein [uncultured Neptuniibacter sp.]